MGTCALRGWLGPSGRFYPCAPWEHDEEAEAVCRSEGIPFTPGTAPVRCELRCFRIWGVDAISGEQYSYLRFPTPEQTAWLTAHGFRTPGEDT